MKLIFDIGSSYHYHGSLELFSQTVRVRYERYVCSTMHILKLEKASKSQ